MPEPGHALGYGRVTKLTTCDGPLLLGSGPVAQPCPATVRGTMVGFSILVRSTTASLPGFVPLGLPSDPQSASKAIASPAGNTPPPGVWYAVTVCGSKPLLKRLPM